MEDIPRRSTGIVHRGNRIEPDKKRYTLAPLDFTPPFGQWLKAQRARLDLTQGDLARRVGYSPDTIRKIEAGALRPSKQIVDLLADHLGVPSAQRQAFLAFATGARVAGKGGHAALGNLPQPLTALIGRDADVAAVLKLLKRGETRLVTLTGPPGVGKTRLAIAVARAAQAQFLDGAWWAELAPITEPEFVMLTIASACGFADLGNRTALERLQQVLRAKALLLVLDNFEQVLAAAPQVAQLLAVAPKIKVIATSREPLHLAAERVFEVPSLALPPLKRHTHASDGVAAAAQSPAVTLFVQRAEAVLPAFALTAANAGVVAEICRRLDGLPLAIELAAARVNALTPKEILARLGERLLLLTSGAQDLPDRQRTLRATIDWSYTLLTPGEQMLFRRFAVFAGGGTLEAIAAVCAPETEKVSPVPVLDGISALVAKSLLKREEGANGESRYRMLETVREYASERLVEYGETDACWERHVDYLWGRFVIWHPDRSFAEMKNADRFGAELANLWAALVWNMVTPDRSENSYRLLRLVDFGHWTLGSTIEWRWIKDMLLQVKDVQPTMGRAYAVWSAAQILALQGEFAAARELWHECVDLFEALNETWHAAFVPNRLGWLAREQGDAETACVWLEKSLARFQALDEPDGMSEALVTLAGVAVLEEDASRATSFLEQAAALPAVRDDFSAGWLLNHAGHVAQLQGDYQHAISLHEASLTPFNNARYLLGPAWAYHGLAETALSLQDAAQAERCFVESLQPFYKLGDKLGISWCLSGLAGAAALNEVSKRAARLWGAGEALRERIGCRIAPASRLNRERTVALLRVQLGDGEFERLAAEGAQMTLDDAVAFALSEAASNVDASQ